MNKNNVHALLRQLGMALLASAALKLSVSAATSMPEDISRSLAELPAIKVEHVDHRNIPTFVRGALGSIHGTIEDANVRREAEKAFPVFRIQKNDLRYKSMKKDHLGSHHFRYGQLKNGLPVVSAELILHVDKTGTIYAASSNIRSDLPFPETAKVGRYEAEKVALSTAPGAKISKQAVLVYVVSNRDSSVHLAYQIEISGTTLRDVVFIDALDGTFVTKHPQIYDARNRSTYTASGTENLPGTLVRGEGSPLSGDSVADITHTNVGITYDYFANIFGRDSFDNAGATVTTTVHFSSDYNNAFWNTSELVFGDGDGVQFASLGLALDIVAHEFTHGITQHSSGLVYNGEPGALNEAISDIFGAMCEASQRGGISGDTWKIGEEVYTPSIAGDALRYMDQPTQDGSSRDYYPERFTGPEDNGGVHWNSGIANLAFKLLVTGGAHPRGKTSVTVPGVGQLVAQQIFYRANTLYTSANDGFAQFRISTVSAANDLYGSSVAASVGLAWDAVGVTGNSAWTQLPGSGTDIGLGADGTTWVIGTDDAGAGNHSISRLSGSGWNQVDGGAVRVSVGPDGNPWVVNSEGAIYRRVNESVGWVLLPGGATDIGVGASGAVWIIGVDLDGAGNNGIYRWNGSFWTKVDGAAVRIAVGPDGNAWVVSASGGIFRRINETTGWVPIPGSASDIGIGADGSVWIIGTDTEGADYGVHKWNGGSWTKIEGRGRQIAVGPDGKPTVVRSDGTIYKLQ